MNRLFSRNALHENARSLTGTVLRAAFPVFRVANKQVFIVKPTDFRA